MSFTPNIPQVGQSLGSSRSQVLNNFANLYNTIAINHGPGNGPNQGKHLQVEMPRQNPTPPVNLANEGTLYSFLSPDAGVNTDIFYTVDATAHQYQLTRIIDANFSRFGTNPGWSFLPGGLIVQWGFHNGDPDGVIAIEPFTPNFTDIPFIVITQPYFKSSALVNSQCTIAVVKDNVTTAGFQWAGVTNSHNYTGFYWVAVGY